MEVKIVDSNLYNKFHLKYSNYQRKKIMKELKSFQ